MDEESEENKKDEQPADEQEQETVAIGETEPNQSETGPNDVETLSNTDEEQLIKTDFSDEKGELTGAEIFGEDGDAKLRPTDEENGVKQAETQEDGEGTDGEGKVKEKEVVEGDIKEGAVMETEGELKENDGELYAGDEHEGSDEDLNIFGEPRASQLGPVVSFSDSSSAEEEEELSERISYFGEFSLVEERKEPIDREAYLDEYRLLISQRTQLRRKNGYLHRKISEYYKKRKMDRVFDDIISDAYDDMLTRYERKMDELYEFRVKAQREKDAVEGELNEMRTHRDQQSMELQRNFAAMTAREKDIATGLIDSKTGKAIGEKIIERLITRQKTKSNEIATIRLAYIKRRDRVREIEAKLKALETIGGTLHLMDFEQLRMENQSFTDKIEERDDELMRLRTRYAHAVQVLAHLREKSDVVVDEIVSVREKECTTENLVCETREYLNDLKIERDANRSLTTKLQLSSGLLTYPRLLKDMETSIQEVAKISEELERLKETHKYTREKLIAIRQTIENTEQIQKRVNHKETAQKTERVYKNRPTLVIPSFPNITRMSI